MSTADYRTYLRLGKNYSLAVRFAGGGSFGANPQKFIIGGVDNWINHTFEGGYIPLENAEDYIFLQTGLPLRGYNYNAGDRFPVRAVQFRIPLSAVRVPAGRSAADRIAEPGRGDVLRYGVGLEQREGSSWRSQRMPRGTPSRGTC